MTKRPHALHIKPQEGLSTEQIQLLNYSRAPDRRHFSDAFYWEECFQSFLLSPSGKAKLLVPSCVHLPEKIPFTGPGTPQFDASLFQLLLQEYPTFGQEHKIKKVIATAACLHEEEEAQPNLLFRKNLHNVIWAFSCCAWRAKTQLFQTIVIKGMKFCFRNYWARASGFGFQPKAKVKAEILIRIAKKLPLKKQPHDGTNNFSATKYSS